MPLFFIEAINIDYIPLQKEALIIAGIFAITAVVCLFFLRKRSVNGIFYSLVIMMSVMLVPFDSALFKVVDQNYTTKYFAQTLQPLLKKNDLVLICNDPSKFYDLQFYLDHPVTLVGLNGELKPHKENRDVERDEIILYISPDEFDSLLKDRKPFYCIIRKRHFNRLDTDIRENLQIIYENPKNILFKSG